MAVTETDIEYRLTGAANNADQSKSLGGVVSSSVVTSGSPGAVYSDITGDQARLGHTAYRGLALFNKDDGGSAFSNVKLFIEQVSTSSDVDYKITKTKNGVNSALETVLANESTRPSGINDSDFVAPASADAATAIDLGNIPANQYYGIWIKRVNVAQSTASSSFSVIISAQGTANL